MRIYKLYIIILLIMLVAVTSVSYAFYLKENNYIVSLDRNDYLVDIKFTFNGIEADTLSPYYDLDKKAFKIDLFDIQAINYIENVGLSVDVNVPIASRMRFRINESYVLTRYYNNVDQTVLEEVIYMTEKDETQHSFSLLKKGTFTNYILHTDRYYYVNDILQTNQTHVFDLINSGISYPVRDNILYYETCYLYVSFDIELIQVNRFSQVWGVDPIIFN